MLASELIYNIKNLRAGGVQSDDEKISDRQYAFIIDYYRAKLVRQEEQKYSRLGREEIQDLGKVKLIQADPHECDCPSDACVLRTELPLPKSLKLAARSHGFNFVGMYGGMSWQEETWHSGPWSMHAKYTGGKTKWILKGRYIYILNPESDRLAYINIQGLFEDPREANQFRTCECEENGLECQTGYDYEYPISAHLVDTLVKMIVESELRLSTILPPDMANDSVDTN
jgi:hypothetical protein